MESLSFNSMARLYEETRVVDENALSSALDFLVDRFPPEKYANLFYPGIGTGRIAIPLARRGYRISSVDISEEMISILRTKLARAGQVLPISVVQADILRMPPYPAPFDMAIAVHLFYFIPDWQRAVCEIIAAVRQNAPLVLMHTGTGMEIPFLNERYKELCREQGCHIEELGVKSTTQVIDYLVTLGYKPEWIRDRWQWSQRIGLDRALGYIEKRAYSFTTFASETVHSRAIKGLESELLQKFGSLASEIEVPNQVYLVILSKPA